MKYKKYLKTLVMIIIILSAITSFVGIFSNKGEGKYTITSIRGEQVTLYGKGIYKNDSISAVAQGIAQDWVVIILGIPMLIIAMVLLEKESLKGKLLLTGTLGYFLYTYMSYTFLWNYNYLFLVYSLLTSCSLFAFILAIMDIDIAHLRSRFNNKFPTKLIGGFQIFFGSAIGMMWLGIIAQSLKGGTVPAGLEHYTTLVIQGMDLAFVLPAAILSGILLIKKNNYGYLFSSIIIIKGVSMGTTLTAMMVNMMMAGVEVSLVHLIVFTLLNVGFIYLFIIFLKHIKLETKDEKDMKELRGQV